MDYLDIPGTITLDYYINYIILIKEHEQELVSTQP